MRKLFVLAILTSLSLIAICQKNKGYEHFFPKEGSKRVVKEEYYRGFEKRPKYVYIYKYNKKGLLTERVKKHWKNNSWLPKETEKYSYDAENGIVICEYVPSAFADGSLDLDLLASIKKMDKARDTIKVENGRVVYLSEYRIVGVKNFRRWYYSYSPDGLTGIKQTKEEYKKVASADGDQEIMQWQMYPTNTTTSIDYAPDGEVLVIEVHKNNDLIQQYDFQKPNDSTRLAYVTYDVKMYSKPRDSYEFLYDEGKFVEGEHKKIGSNRFLKKYYTKYNHDGTLQELEKRPNLVNKRRIRVYEYGAGFGNASLFSFVKDVEDLMMPGVE